MIITRLKFLPVGHAAEDIHGDVWVRTKQGATVVILRGRRQTVQWLNAELAEADEQFGPMTPIPEVGS